MTAYRDRDWFIAELEASGWNLNEMAVRTGFKLTTLRHWKSHHAIPYPEGIGDPRAWVRRGDAQRRAASSDMPQSHGMVAEALRRSKEALTVAELADAVDMSPKRVREAIADLGRRGYNVDLAADEVRLDTTSGGAFHPDNAAHDITFEGDEYLCGTISDTHLGSDHECVDVLHAAYDEFERRGIADVYHGGDLVAGIGVYGARQRNTLHKQTYEQQVDYAVSAYPRKSGITTHIIGGNHDLEGDFGRIGADPVRAVANEREDFNYLGKYSAFLNLPNGARIHLLHPMGGSSYAKSYRPQKLVESYTPAMKPDALWIAHWHSTMYIVTRGVHTFLLGTTEGQNELGIRKGLGEPAIGFWVHRITMGKRGILKYVPEWYGVPEREA